MESSEYYQLKKTRLPFADIGDKTASMNSKFKIKSTEKRKKKKKTDNAALSL